MKNEEEGSSLLEPPRYDMIVVGFRGDDFTLRMPYCEVANGQLQGANETHVLLTGAGGEPIEVPRSSFKDLIEKSFDHKDVVKLAIQLKETFEIIDII